MKKIILFMGFLLVCMIISPMVNATDSDIGYKYELPADQNAVVSTECQADINSFQCVVPVELRDHGDRYMEFTSTSLSGLRAESPTITVPYTNGDVTFITSVQRDRHGTRIYNMNTRGPNYRILSSSNGGIGY